MNEDYKELVGFLSGKFEKIDDKFDKIDDKFDKIDNRFDKIETKLDNKADKEITDKILASQDEIITKLDTLLQEKTIGDEQDKRQKKVLEIHNSALKSNKILSENQASEIDGLRVF